MLAAVDDVRDASYSFRWQFSAYRASVRRTESSHSIISSESVRARKIQLSSMRGKPGDRRDDEGLVAADVVQVAERDREVDLLLLLRGS